MITNGDTVRWTNISATTSHDSTSSNGVWVSGLFLRTPYSFKFTTAGLYPYHCQFHQVTHPEQNGTINVVAAPRPVQISCPQNMAVPCDSQDGATVSFTATATDESGTPISVMCVPPSGSRFPFGASSVRCDAMDSQGQSNSCSFTITVSDTTAPTINCPNDIVVGVDPGQCGATVDYAALSLSATDVCSTAILVCNPPSGSLLPLGTNAVTCTATDARTNRSQCTFSVVVKELPQAPVITATHPIRDARIYSNEVQICMSSSFTDAMIYYTDDGSVPSNASKRYTNCFTLYYQGQPPDLQQITIKAIAYGSNGTASAAACPVDVFLAPYCDGNFKLLTSTSGGGEVRKDPLRDPYPCDTIVQLHAVPAEGWTFLGWLGDVRGTDPNPTLLISRDTCAEAVFGTQLGTNVAGNGSIQLTPLINLYPYDSRVTILARPDAGFYFAHWTNLPSLSSSERTANPLRLQVTEAQPSVTAVFAPLAQDEHSLAVWIDGLGSVITSPFSNRYPSSATVSLHALPAADQQFLAWSGDTADSNSFLMLTMTQDRFVQANFTRMPRLEIYHCDGKLKADMLQLCVRGELAAAYAIEATEQLASPSTWETLGVITNTLGCAQFDDPRPAGPRQRFYRARLSP